MVRILDFHGGDGENEMDRSVVEVRLHHWAAWVHREVHDGGTGWQGISTLGRVIEQGIDGASIRGHERPLLDTGMPADLQATQAAIDALSPALKEAIYARWNLLRSERTGVRVSIKDAKGRECRPVPYRLLATVLGVNRSTLSDRLQLAMEEIGITLDIVSELEGAA